MASGPSGWGVDVGVGDSVGEGVADADAEAEGDPALGATCDALPAACDALPAAWLLLVDDVQPAIDNEAITTSAMMINNFLFNANPP